MAWPMTGILRGFCGLLAAVFLLPGIGPAHADDRPRVYFLVHTDTKSAILEKALQDKLPKLSVIVFGRFRDFQDALAARRPDAIVALHPVLTSFKVPVVLQGLRADQDWEPYVVLSTHSETIDGPLEGKVIGVIDILGRNDTQAFVNKLVGTEHLKLKRVTKVEDLLPLLQFSAADGVLVPGTAVKSVAERSHLPLLVREFDDAKVGLIALGVLNRWARDVTVKQIQSLNQESNRALGIDRWRAQ
jgi:hypothetical protein